jgi:cytochrome c5
MVHDVVRRIRWSLLCLGTIGGLPVITVVATQPPAAPSSTRERTVWQGVYSANQAERGRTAYDRHCASCHGNALTGGSTPPLLGDAFMRNWSEGTLFDLFDKIRSTMPPNMGRDLNNDAYIDIVAYVLQQNTFPEGPEALGSDPGLLRQIRIESHAGPAPVPTFALVTVVGCLERQVGEEWVLTHATDAVRTRLPYGPETADTGPGVTERPGAPVSGTLSFRLFGIYPKPDSHVGHQVEVRGFLIRNAAADRINVTSLRTVTFDCRVPQE